MSGNSRSGVECRGLPTDFREVLEGIVDSADAAGEWKGSTGGDLLWGKNYLVESGEIEWITRGSERVVAGFGRSFNGETLTDDKLSVVVKFQPWLDSCPVPNTDAPQSANHRTIAIWNTAVEQDDTDLFPELFDFDRFGRWIAVEECLPIYKRWEAGPSGRAFLVPDAIDSNRNIDSLLSERGWMGDDVQFGNIGVSLEGDFVILDAGRNTKYIGPEQSTEDTYQKDLKYMKFKYELTGTPLSAEVTLSAEDDHVEAVERLVETLEQVDIDVEYSQTQGQIEKTNPGSRGGQTETAPPSSSGKAQSTVPECLAEFAEKAQVAPSVLGDIIDVDSEEDELPYIVEGASKLGDTKKERQLRATLVILAVRDACYDTDEDKILTSDLKDALEYSGIDSGSLSNMYSLDNAGRVFDRSGRGSTAKIGLSRPGQREARKVANQLVSSNE